MSTGMILFKQGVFYLSWDDSVETGMILYKM